MECESGRPVPERWRETTEARTEVPLEVREVKVPGSGTGVDGKQDSATTVPGGGGVCHPTGVASVAPVLVAPVPPALLLAVQRERPDPLTPHQPHLPTPTYPEGRPEEREAVGGPGVSVLCLPHSPQPGVDPLAHESLAPSVSVAVVGE